MCQHHENIEEDKFGYQWGKCKLCGHVTEYGLLHDMLVKMDSGIQNLKGLEYSPLTPYHPPSYNIRGVGIC